MPNEKKSATSAISSARSAARGSSIIVPQRYSSLRRLLVHHLDSVSSRSRRSSSREADERMHDLDERRLARALLHGLRRARDRAHLHLVDLRPLDAEPAAARAEHRVRLVQRADPRGASARRSPPRAAAGTRAAAGRAAGSSPAARPSPRRSPRSRTAGTAGAGRARRGGPPRRAARIISCITGSRSSPKNMCSVRQSPMPSAPNSRAFAASSGVVGVRAHLRAGGRRPPSRGSSRSPR